MEDTPAAVALDAHGDGVAVWSEAIVGLSVDYVVRAAARPAGGRWQPASTLANGGLNPMVAIDAAGNAVAVWESASGIPVAVRPVGGAWSAPRALDAGSGKDPQVAGNARGDAIVVWSDAGIRASIRPAGRAFSPAQTISMPKNVQNARVALDAGGDALVAWVAVGGQASFVQAAFRPSGGRWSRPATLSGSPVSSDGPRVAIDGRGGAIVAWVANHGLTVLLQAAMHKTDGGWTPKLAVASGPAIDEPPNVAMDGRGDATVVWSQSSVVGNNEFLPHSSRIWTRTRVAGHGWNSPERVAHASGSSPSITVDARGNALLAWEGSAVEAAIRPSGGQWEKPRALSRRPLRTAPPQVVLDAHGDALVAWQDNSDLAEASIETAVHPSLFP